MTTTRLRIAVQKSGRLHDESLSLLNRCGLKIRTSKNALFCQGENLPIDLLYVRDDDIPTLVMDNVCDLGIVGENVLQEQLYTHNEFKLEIIQSLGFGHCKVCLAAPKEFLFNNLSDLAGKKIATSHSKILQNFLNQQQLYAEIIELCGSIEIAPRLGLADLICDLVSTGETLAANNLQILTTILSSQAVLIKAERNLATEKLSTYQTLMQRLHGV